MSSAVADRSLAGSVKKITQEKKMSRGLVVAKQGTGARDTLTTDLASFVRLEVNTTIPDAEEIP